MKFGAKPGGGPTGSGGAKPGGGCEGCTGCWVLRGEIAASAFGPPAALQLAFILLAVSVGGTAFAAMVASGAPVTWPSSPLLPQESVSSTWKMKTPMP